MRLKFLPGSTRNWTNHRLVELLSAALVLVAIALALVNFTVDYKKTQQEIEGRALAYAVSMATDVRWYVEVARQALARTAERLQGVPQEEISSALSRTLSELPAGVTIVIYDAAGTSVASNGPLDKPISVADRAYFQDLVSGKPWTVSNLLADRVTGTMTFAIGLPLRQGGQFSGAAVAYAPMGVFREAWLGAGGTRSNAFIVHEEGWITARLPPVDSAVYDSKVGQPFLERFAEDRGVDWATASPIDGEVRVLGYAKVAAAPLIAVVGLSEGEQFAQFWRQVIVTLAVLIPILLLLTLASIKIRNLIVGGEQTASQLADSLEKNRLLLLEIHHRVKNNLQAVMSLARTQIKDRDAVEFLQSRITTMSAVHEHIYQNDGFLDVPASDYIREIAAKVLLTSDATIELVTQVAPLRLPAKYLMPLGQLINEAIINAIKYGYQDGRTGTITIRMDIAADRKAVLTIHNDGAPLSQEGKKGLGSRLMHGFAMQLNGTVTTRSDDTGVTVSIVFEVPENA